MAWKPLAIAILGFPTTSIAAADLLVDILALMVKDKGSVADAKGNAKDEL